jgi:hypothetical protein
MSKVTWKLTRLLIKNDTLETTGKLKGAKFLQSRWNQIWEWKERAQNFEDEYKGNGMQMQISLLFIWELNYICRLRETPVEKRVRVK